MPPRDAGAPTVNETPHAVVGLIEEERARVARTLHDELGQALTGLKMDLHKLHGALSSSTPEVLTKDVESILQRLDDAIQSVRRVSGELRPGVLDRLGLLAAIEWQAAEFERRSGIRCRVDARIDHIPLDSSGATAAFRIVQEALTNVLRHAAASRVTITIRESDNRLVLSVADNGRGISARRLAQGDSLGLLGMRERADLLGGTLNVRRRRPRGTLVTLRAPLVQKRVRSAR
jgi:signal transduction histidine kinase